MKATGDLREKQNVEGKNAICARIEDGILVKLKIKDNIRRNKL